MTTFKNINEYNNYLADKLTKYTIDEYFKQIIKHFNKSIDITFMDYFLTLIEREDEFCVKHDKLIEYGVISERKDNSHIKRCIDSYEFVENIDYVVLTPQRWGVKREGRGGSNGNAKQYEMKPHAFKMCLMRSKNTKAYAKYYMELEKCFYYYNKYQIKYQKVLLSGKDTKIDDLNKKVDDVLQENKKQSEEIKELLKYAKNTKVSLDEANENIDELHDKVDDLTDKVEEVREEFRENLEHLNPPLDDQNKLHVFKLLQTKNKLNELKIVKGKKPYVLRKCRQIGLENKNVIIDTTYNPNPNGLYDLLRIKIDALNEAEIDKIVEQSGEKDIQSAKLKNISLKYYRNPIIKTRYTDITLDFKRITLNDFLELLYQCDNFRRETYVP